VTELVTLGETLALLSTPEVGPLRRMHFLRLGAAGAESNVAIGLCRLGHSAAFIGRVGNDELGRLIVESLRAEGVDVRGLHEDMDGPTAIMLKERRLADLTRVTYYRRGSAGSRLSPEDIDEAMVGQASLLHVTGITLALSPTARNAVHSALEIARSAGVAISLDVNFRSALWSRKEATSELSQLARLADLVFASDDELGLLTPLGSEPTVAELEHAALAFADDSGQEIVVTRGRAGAFSVSHGDILHEPPVEVTSLDPVGAGDAFVSGYLSAFLDGEPPRPRLRRGCLAGAFAVSVDGDWEGLPRRDELSLLSYRPDATLR